MMGVVLALAARSPLAGFVVCTAGAASGTLLWVFAGESLRRIARRWLPRRRSRRVFSQMSRLLVRLRRRRALVALALLTPTVLSMPLGCALALSVEPRPRRVVLAVWAAVVAWSSVLFGARAILLEATPASTSSPAEERGDD